MLNWYLETIVNPGRQPLFLALVAFVATFILTRAITRLIRSGKGPFGNVSAGDLHVHHMVPGVICVLVGGMMALSVSRHGIWIHLAGILFGIGAALVLDEFAMILHLEDVYWQNEGRLSADAVLIAMAVMGCTIWVVAPDNPPGPPETDPWVRVIGPLLFAVLWIVPTAVTVLKGKLLTAAMALWMPYFAWVGAWRLAKPNSPYALFRYQGKPEKLARAQRRYDRIQRRVKPMRDFWMYKVFGFSRADDEAADPAAIGAGTMTDPAAIGPGEPDNTATAEEADRSSVADSATPPAGPERDVHTGA